MIALTREKNPGADACSFLFMHIKKTTASALVFHFFTIYLLRLLFAHIFVFCVFRYAFSFHFF